MYVDDSVGFGYLVFFRVGGERSISSIFLSRSDRNITPRNAAKFPSRG